MKKVTLKEVIVKVLEKENSPLASQEIYDRIVKEKLYEFRSKTPAAIVNAELRKNTQGVDLKKSSKTKVFKIVERNKFSLI